MALSVSRSDLEQASNAARDGLSNVSSSSTQVSGQISSFITESREVLKGQGFDYVRDRLYMYQTAIDKLVSICETLANNIIAANNQMINATKGLDLDTENLEELEQRVKQIESLISWYSELVVVDPNVSEEERQYKMRDQAMKGYYEEVLAIIQERLELLRNLETISNQAASLLDTVGADISTYSSNVSSITVASL